MDALARQTDWMLARPFTPKATRKTKCFLTARLLISGLGLIASCARAATASAAGTQNPSAPLAVSATPANSGKSGATWDEFRDTVRPFLVKHCFDCHGDEDGESGFRLDLIRDEGSLLAASGTLEKAFDRLARHKMPPREQPQPSAAEAAPILAWLETHLVGDPNAPINPGRVTVRRLNRAEYNNTIRDLLAIDLRPADSFPADDLGYGFDNNGDVLSVAPVLMEKYLTAASLSLDKAIFAEPVIPPPMKSWQAAMLEGTIPKSDPLASVTRGTPEVGGGPRVAILLGRIFNYSGEIFLDYDVPTDGEYILRVRAYGTPGAGRQRPQVAFLVDGQMVQKPITVVEDQKNAAFDALDKTPLTAGKHRISLAFLNGATPEEYTLAQLSAPPAPLVAAAPKPINPNADDDDKPVRAALSPSGTPTLGVIAIDLEGPMAVTPERMPESYRRVMVAQPSAKLPKPQAAEKIIRAFATRAYRRPVREDEVSRLMKLWTKADGDGRRFEESIQHTLQAVMVSPAFLFRIELEPLPGEPGGVHVLTEYELATRLSYFLWCSMPDDELFASAEKGTLRANLQAQVRRMLKDPKASALVQNFASQWLQLRSMQHVTPDIALFPAFDEGLRDAMTKETELFVNAIVQDDRSILDFINADFTFVNERLAKHYGLPGVAGDDFRRVALPPERGGLLTQGSILTLTSMSNRTSPVLRGKWVLENLFDTPPPPPPPNVPALVEGEKHDFGGTMRQRLEQHRKNPSCAACHEEMDGIGFALENFDAVGAWRTQDNNKEIDAAGTLPGGKSFNGPAELRRVIQSQSEEFARCLASKMLTFALGRGLQAYDRRAIDAIVTGMKNRENKFSALIDEVVRSEAFQKRNGKPERGDL